MCNSCGGKSNQQSKRKKASKRKTGKCLETDERHKEPPKCPNKKKRVPPKPKNYLTKIEKIMMRIQPPIADRERYLHPEHVNCFLEESERVFINKPAYGFHPSRRPKFCADDKENKTKKKSNNDVEDGENKDRKMKQGGRGKVANEEKDAGSDAVEQQVGDSAKADGDNEKLERGNTRRQVKANKKKKKQARRRERDIEDDSDSELSICSIDSEVCLIGVSLTKEDKKTIEENRRKVHPTPDNEDETVEGDDNISDATQHGKNQTETEELKNEKE